jgi:putative drug exporter of the RND superfamily
MTLTRLARWCYQRRWRVLIAWIVLLVAMNVVSSAVGSAYNNSFSGGNSDSAAALSLLQNRFPQAAGDTATIVFSARGGVDDPAVRARMESLFSQIGPGRVAHVTGVRSPYQAPSQISRSGTVAYATVQFNAIASSLPQDAAQPLITAAERAGEPGLKIALGGPVVEQAVQKQGGSTELIGVLAAVVILFIAFGSLLAMTLPIIAALFGVGVGSTFVVLLSHAMLVPSFAPYLAVMIGLGVGIDYALFIITRYRAGLHDGLSPENADVLALTTAGRAVLFAGCTVVISLLGMFMLGLSLIYGFAIGAVLAVLMVMLASVTLVPAIIGFAGPKLAAKQRRRARRRELAGPGETFSYRWSRQIQKRPWAWGALSLLLLVALALPLFSMRLGASDEGNDPQSYTTRQAFDLLAEGFGPGFNGPLLLAAAVEGHTTTTSIQGLVQAVKADTDVAYASPVRLNPARNAAVVTVIPRSAPQASATADLVHRIRSQISSRGLAVHVGGETAIAVDGSGQMGRRLPWMVTAVVLLSFLLLMILFRSVIVALKAVVMNLLSVGAAYGAVVTIFQWGWLQHIFGVSAGPIEFWMPMLMFTVLFGLSMDYEVFLLSRIKEEYLLSGNNSEAVSGGLASTARVITAAAAIMVCVFLSFALVDLRVVKLLGVGLAIAIFVDATVVRMVLVPSVMQLLGDANWWMPGWLQKMVPHIGPGPAAPVRDAVPDVVYPGPR